MHMIFISPTFYKNKKPKDLEYVFILLIYHLIHVFFYFSGAYCKKYTVLIKKVKKKMVTYFCTLNIRTWYSNYTFLAA